MSCSCCVLDWLPRQRGREDSYDNPLLTYHLESCVTGSDSGEFNPHHEGLANALVPSGRRKVLGVCCNYDPAQGTDGANDNASSVAVMLDLVDRFHRTDQEGRRIVTLDNIGVEFYFLCNGASNSLGAFERADALRGVDGSTPLVGMYNLKMVGIGDRVVAWPLPKGHDGLLLRSLRAAVREHNQYFGDTAKGSSAPQPLAQTSDIKPFQDLGIEAFCVSAATKKDLKAMERYYDTVARNPDPYRLASHVDTSIFMKSIDSSDEINERTLQMVSDIMYRAIRFVDMSYRD